MRKIATKYLGINFFKSMLFKVMTSVGKLMICKTFSTQIYLNHQICIGHLPCVRQCWVLGIEVTRT